MSSNKKFLVISREGGDFSMDLVFAGLVRRFGKENVIDYPPRDKFRQGKPSLVGDHEKDYGAERRSLCYVDGCEDMRRYTQRDIMSMWSDIGVVFMDETDESYAIWLSLFQFYSGIVPTVIIAGHDSFRGNPHEVMGRLGPHLLHMFIDDWFPTYDSLERVSLINLSCNFDHLWDHTMRDHYLKNKVYDICFIGYNSNPWRKVVIDHVKRKWGQLNNCIIFEERSNKFEMFVRHDKMFEMMARSKVCLNLPGASTTGRALRYYEIPYVGSCMVTSDFPARLLHPFSVPVFGHLDELDKILETLLFRDEKGRERIARTEHEHCMRHHTVDARMNYVFEVLDGQEDAVRHYSQTQAQVKGL